MSNVWEHSLSISFKITLETAPSLCRDANPLPYVEPQSSSKLFLSAVSIQHHQTDSAPANCFGCTLPCFSSYSTDRVSWASGTCISGEGCTCYLRVFKTTSRLRRHGECRQDPDMLTAAARRGIYPSVLEMRMKRFLFTEPKARLSHVFARKEKTFFSCL